MEKLLLHQRRKTWLYADDEKKQKQQKQKNEEKWLQEKQRSAAENQQKAEKKLLLEERLRKKRQHRESVEEKQEDVKPALLLEQCSKRWLSNKLSDPIYLTQVETSSFSNQGVQNFFKTPSFKKNKIPSILFPNSNSRELYGFRNRYRFRRRSYPFS